VLTTPAAVLHALAGPKEAIPSALEVSPGIGRAGSRCAFLRTGEPLEALYQNPSTSE